MSSTLSIHPARSASDLDGARAVLLAYSAWIERDLGYSLARQCFPSELESLPGRYAPPTGDIWVAELDSKIIGAIAYYKFAEGIAELKRLYVLPEAGGHGIGRKLFDAVLHAAKANGYEKIRLDTLRAMESARKIYAHYAFREIEPWNENHKDGDLIYLELETSSLPNL